MAPALRLMIFDRTCGGRFLPGLTESWRVGGRLYRALGRLDGWSGFSTWADALEWLATFRAGEPLAEIQFWGHGRWGEALIDRRALDVTALKPGHPLESKLARVRERLRGPGALWWFRTCETFGAAEGHRFARAWTQYFGCRAAGHTFVIGPWQSGLHSLAPGAEPRWSLEEGVSLNASGERRPQAKRSSPWQPNTISCLHGTVPEGW